MDPADINDSLDFYLKIGTAPKTAIRIMWVNLVWRCVAILIPYSYSLARANWLRAARPVGNRYKISPIKFYGAPGGCLFVDSCNRTFVGLVIFQISSMYIMIACKKNNSFKAIIVQKRNIIILHLNWFQLNTYNKQHVNKKY